MLSQANVEECIWVTAELNVCWVWCSKLVGAMWAQVHFSYVNELLQTGWSHVAGATQSKDCAMVMFTGCHDCKRVAIVLQFGWLCLAGSYSNGLMSLLQ